MYKALNYWVFGGFGPNKTPYEFIDFAKAQSLDGVELTVGDCLSIDIDEAECRKIAAYAKEKGFYNLTLNVWSRNAAALRFYEACGLTPQKMGMELLLQE